MRSIEDENYLARLPQYYWKAHERWKDRILSVIDDFMLDLETVSLPDAMSKYKLSQRDIALLVRLNVVSDDEAARYGMNAIEAVMPL